MGGCFPLVHASIFLRHVSSLAQIITITLVNLAQALRQNCSENIRTATFVISGGKLQLISQLKEETRDIHCDANLTHPGDGRKNSTQSTVFKEDFLLVSFRFQEY